MDLARVTELPSDSFSSDNKESGTNESDVETRSQTSLVDSLESEVIEEKQRTEIKPWRPSRLPRLRRSQTVNSDGAVNNNEQLIPTRKERPTRLEPVSPRANNSAIKSTSYGNLFCLQREDCGSTHSLCRWNSDSRAQVRENTTSKRRFELQHCLHDQETDVIDYLTPSQRKEQLIKELKAQVRELKHAIDLRDMDASQLKQDLKQETEEEDKKRNEELESARKELEEMRQKYAEISKSHEESVKSVANLEQTIAEMKATMEGKEKEQEKIYLQMYRKGRQVAQIERQEELEDMVSKGIRSPSFTIRELVRKLAVTETELAKWQSLRRKESYDEGDKAGTEAEATLHFLKDSFLHYLTDVKDSDDHLRAMIRIFKFDEEQKKLIAKALLDGKHLKK